MLSDCHDASLTDRIRISITHILTERDCCFVAIRERALLSCFMYEILTPTSEGMSEYVTDSGRRAPAAGMVSSVHCQYSFKL